jgi:lipoyl(octanoyl) transferase
MMDKICNVLELERISYSAAWDLQHRLFAARRRKERKDILLLLEHDPVYTIGRAGSRSNILVSGDTLADAGIRVFEVDRGGDITFHGPGQLVGYPILDLAGHGKDLHQYVRRIEEVLIRTIGGFGIRGWREEGLTGVWTEKGKIAAIGVGVKGWITMHGFSLNVAPDMNYFKMINPCGITDRPVASMRDFGASAGMDDVKQALIRCFSDVFAVKIIPVRSIDDGNVTARVAQD